MNHLSDSVSIVDVGAEPAARRAHAARRRRAARHRLRRAADGGVFTARVRHDRAPRPEPAGRRVPPHAHDRGHRRARSSGSSTRATSAPRSAARRETVIELFGDTPRALAATPDGSTVYAAVFHSGNQTTAVTEGAVCDGGAGAAPCALRRRQVAGRPAGRQVPGGLPAPNANVESVAGPEVGLIVKFDRDDGEWQDELGRNWSNGVRFDLPDLDVFAIDAHATPPARDRRLRARRHGALQHGREPGDGHALRHQHRGAERGPLRGPGRSAATHRARPPARGAHHRDRRRRTSRRAT